MSALTVVDTFRDNYAWLSNFSPMGGAHPTAEHHYQAHKATNVPDTIYVMGAGSAKIAKQRGNAIRCRDDWEDVKLDIMYDVLVLKFGIEPIQTMLLNTGDAELIEGNYWGDRYWGVCRGEGENFLGELLMVLRDEIRRNR